MRIFNDLSTTARMMLLSIAIICLFFLILGLAVIFIIYPFEKPVPYATGLAAGCVLSLAKVVLLEKSMNRSVDMESKHAQTYAYVQLLIRYALTIVMLVSVVLFPGVIGLFGVIPGILSLQFGAYVANFILKKKGYPVD